MAQTEQRRIHFPSEAELTGATGRAREGEFPHSRNGRKVRRTTAVRAHPKIELWSGREALQRFRPILPFSLSVPLMRAHHFPAKHPIPCGETALLVSQQLPRCLLQQFSEIPR